MRGGGFAEREAVPQQRSPEYGFLVRLVAHSSDRHFTVASLRGGEGISPLLRAIKLGQRAESDLLDRASVTGNRRRFAALKTLLRVPLGTK